MKFFVLIRVFREILQLSSYFKTILTSSSGVILTAAVTVSSLSSNTTSSTPSPAEDPVTAFRSLQYALFTTCFVEVLGGFFFLLTALHIVEDRAVAERQLQG